MIVVVVQALIWMSRGVERQHVPVHGLVDQPAALPHVRGRAGFGEQQLGFAAICVGVGHGSACVGESTLLAALTPVQHVRSQACGLMTLANPNSLVVTVRDAPAHVGNTPAHTLIEFVMTRAPHEPATWQKDDEAEAVVGDLRRQIKAAKDRMRDLRDGIEATGRVAPKPPSPEETA